MLDGQARTALELWAPVLSGMSLCLCLWGDVYGDLTDRFGISWGFNIAAAQA